MSMRERPEERARVGSPNDRGFHVSPTIHVADILITMGMLSAIVVAGFALSDQVDDNKNDVEIVKATTVRIDRQHASEQEKIQADRLLVQTLVTEVRHMNSAMTGIVSEQQAYRIRMEEKMDELKTLILTAKQ